MSTVFVRTRVSAVWVNGKVAMDFPNLRLRDADSLKIDYVQIGMFIQNSNHPTAKKWYDNVVAATSYIGPIAAKADNAPRENVR